jgi:hypothetical protein
MAFEHTTLYQNPKLWLAGATILLLVVGGDWFVSEILTDDTQTNRDQPETATEPPADKFVCSDTVADKCAVGAGTVDMGSVDACLDSRDAVIEGATEILEREYGKWTAVSSVNETSQRAVCSDTA